MTTEIIVEKVDRARPRGKNGRTLSERLSERSVRDECGCLLWQGAVTKKGHGKLNVSGRTTTTHRVAWVEAYGHINDDGCVLHKCDVPNCIEPTHLFLGTVADNNLDMVTKRRHAFGHKNGKSKFTDWRVQVVRAAYKGGVPICELARRLPVSQSTLSALIARKTWAHVADHITTGQEEGA